MSDESKPEVKQYVDYSEAIATGVFKWMDANSAAIFEIIKTATGSAVEMMGAGTMAAVSKFLTENAQDLKSAVAAAVAANFVSKSFDRKGQ